MKKDILERFAIFSRGLAMGMADVVPGVSGGTIALISGIYDHLINSLSQFSLSHLIDLFHFISPFSKKEKKKDARKNLSEIDWSFLLSLLSGIAIAILVMSRVITYLLAQYYAQCFAFFFGLIIFSLPVPLKEVTIDIKSIIVMAIFGLITYFFLAGSAHITGSENLIYVFITGSVAICAMILPGISGSYILLLMGQYKLILDALNRLDIPIIAVFLLGIVVGIYSFLRVLKFLLSKYHSLTMAAMTGIMIGSLRKIWPYSYTASVNTELHIQIVGLIVLGGTIAVFVSWIGHKYSI